MTEFAPEPLPLPEEYLDSYIEAAGIAGEKSRPLFRTTRGTTRALTRTAMNRFDVHKMIKRRAEEAGLPRSAAHESPRTTKLYDRTSDAISLDEIERIVI